MLADIRGLSQVTKPFALQGPPPPVAVGEIGR